MTTRLKQLHYEEFIGQDREWILNHLKLQKLNLIVGKNATGKSRIANVINALAGAMTYGRKLSDGKWEVELSSTEYGEVSYNLEIINNKVVNEQLTINKNDLLHRDATGSGKIHFAQLNQDIEFNIPQELIAAVIRRDPLQHPFLSPLFSWASNTVLYRFGSDMQIGTLAASRKNDSVDLTRELPGQDIAATAAFIRGLDEFGPAFETDILNDVIEIGYKCSKISAQSTAELRLNVNNIDLDNLKALHVWEDGINGPVPQYLLSQGMWRALATIIHINYFSRKNTGGTIILDDIGEGLDFDRSTKLIKLLTRKAEIADLSLIMTTNDRFVMNAISIDHWSIAERDGTKVTVFNAENAKEAFDNFKYSGLNNFDFFSNRETRSN